MAGDFGIYSERKLKRSIQDKADDLGISYAEARKLILEQVIKPANEQFEENFQKLLNKIVKKLSVPLKAQELRKRQWTRIKCCGKWMNSVSDGFF